MKNKSVKPDQMKKVSWCFCSSSATSSENLSRVRSFTSRRYTEWRRCTWSRTSAILHIWIWKQLLISPVWQLWHDDSSEDWQDAVNVFLFGFEQMNPHWLWGSGRFAWRWLKSAPDVRWKLGRTKQKYFLLLHFWYSQITLQICVTSRKSSSVRENNDIIGECVGSSCDEVFKQFIWRIFRSHSRLSYVVMISFFKITKLIYKFLPYCSLEIVCEW